jgi:rubrerythrin
MPAVDDFVTANQQLMACDVLDVDAMRLMYRLEMAGETFYEMLAAGVGNDEAAALLRKNGREERGHAERIRKALGHKLGRDYQPEGDDLVPLKVDLPESIPVELFPAIAAGEVAGDAGYQAWADKESDPEVEKLLRRNGREETKHSKRVNEAFEILQAASSGSSSTSTESSAPSA